MQSRCGWSGSQRGHEGKARAGAKEGDKLRRKRGRWWLRSQD